MILSLANGQNYKFISGKSGEGFLEEFSRIMQLQDRRIFPISRVLLFRNADIEGIIRKYHPAKFGWKSVDNGFVKFFFHHTLPDIFCDIGIIQEEEYFKMKHFLWCVFMRSIKAGGLPFHSGLVKRENKGILFVGSSGAGKSTTCRRSPWEVLCDDTALVVKSDDYRVHPFPSWGDYIKRRKKSEFNTSYNVPLQAIFLIEKSEEEKIIKLKARDAALKLFKNSMERLYLSFKALEKEEKNKFNAKLFNNIWNLLQKVPVYALKISLQGEFWKKIEEVI